MLKVQDENKKFPYNMRKAEHLEDGIVFSKCWLGFNEDSIHILSLETLEEYRNQGHCQNFLQELIEFAKGENKKLTLEVRKENSVARHIYEKMGFKYTEPSIWPMEIS